MSQRPRLGGAGRLERPSEIWMPRGRGVAWDAGDVICWFVGSERYDPFERREDGLLLAESFARLDVNRPAFLRRWVQANGTLAAHLVIDGDEYLPDDEDVDTQDRADTWRSEQWLVREMLRELVVLSGTKPVGTEDWDPRWFPRGEWTGNFQEPTRDSMFRLARFWIKERVEAALRPDVMLGWHHPSAVEVIYRWRSVLAPIHLQLFEALRRVSEEKVGATVCQECRNPMLVLDGRRTTFCTASEANRHRVREWRAKAVGEEGVTR